MGFFLGCYKAMEPQHLVEFLMRLTKFVSALPLLASKWWDITDHDHSLVRVLRPGLCHASRHDYLETVRITKPGPFYLYPVHPVSHYHWIWLPVSVPPRQISRYCAFYIRHIKRHISIHHSGRNTSLIPTKFKEHAFASEAQPNLSHGTVSSHHGHDDHKEHLFIRIVWW